MALPTQRDFEETLQAQPNTLRRQRVTVGTNLRGINLASWGATQYDVTIKTKRRHERTQQPGAENVPPGEAPVAAPAPTHKGITKPISEARPTATDLAMTKQLAEHTRGLHESAESAANRKRVLETLRCTA